MYNRVRSKNILNITFSATYKHVDTVSQDVKDMLKDRNLKQLIFEVELGVREVLTNAVRHGSLLNSEKRVKFELKIKRDRVQIQVKDYGEGFNWRHFQSNQVSESSTHGRGIRILKDYFDELQFNTIGNQVKLVKYIIRAGGKP